MEISNEHWHTGEQNCGWKQKWTVESNRMTSTRGRKQIRSDLGEGTSFPNDVVFVLRNSTGKQGTPWSIRDVHKVTKGFHESQVLGWYSKCYGLSFSWPWDSSFFTWVKPWQKVQSQEWIEGVRSIFEPSDVTMYPLVSQDNYEQSPFLVENTL